MNEQILHQMPAIVLILGQVGTETRVHKYITKHKTHENINDEGLNQESVCTQQDDTHGTSMEYHWFRCIGYSNEFLFFKR